MIDLVIIKYGFRKEDKHKCYYRAKGALTRLKLQIGGRYGIWEGFRKSKEIE